MSKLSFRARALDASKPMPIYLAEELPDLPDYSAINRAVPQMPSGMEKEEESEHHLQRAISGTGLIIPTPEVCEVNDLHFYERCYPHDYKMPKQHIHMQPLWEEQEAPEYDIDTEDERWLKQQRHPELTELLFEQMMDKLEKCSGQTVVTLNEAKLLLERKDDLVIAVYDYWLNKRLNTQHALILSVKTESRPGQSSNNPYLAFRRRTEKMQTRKNRKNDESSYEKMLKLRRDLARALTLLQMVARREEAKRDLVKLTAQLADKRYAARDFANQLLPEPPPRPQYTPVPLPAPAFRREAYTVQHYPPRAPPTPVDQPRQREKRPYKRRKYRHQVVGSALGLRDSGVCTSSEEESVPRAETASPPDDGPFSFRRKPGCYYEMPTSTLCGDPVDPADAAKEGMFQHELDVRHRYTLTSIAHPYPKCLGLARRRVGRGGRVLLDRVATPLDALWPRLEFAQPDSTRYRQERDEEVELETKAHRTPKEMSRDYHTSGKHPWRHAFRQHLSKHPHLWTADVKLDVKMAVDDVKMDVDDQPVSDLPQDSDISVRTIEDNVRSAGPSETARDVDSEVRGNLDRVMRKRVWSDSDSSYDSDESLHPVEKEFEEFITEVNKKWLHFRPKTPPPSPPHEEDTDRFPISTDTPISVELRPAETSPTECLDPFTTTEFTLADIYTDSQDIDISGSSLDVTDDLLTENFTGLTEAQVESLLFETDLKSTDKKIAEDILDELVKDVDVKDPFLYQGQGLDGRLSSGLKRRRPEQFGSTVVHVAADREPIYVEKVELKVVSPPPPPKKLVTPVTEERAERPAPCPVPNSKIIIEEVNEVPPQIKLDKRKPAPTVQQDTIEEVQLPHGVQLKTVQTKHSPLKKHIITSAAHRRASDVTVTSQEQQPQLVTVAVSDSLKNSPLKKHIITSAAHRRASDVTVVTSQETQQPQLVTVAVSDSLKVRLQNHLLSSQAGASSATVVGLVPNGPYAGAGGVALALPMHQQRDTGVTTVSVAGTSSPRRVNAPLVHLAPALSHKQLQIHPQPHTIPTHPPVVVAQSHTIHHVAPNKLKVLHAHTLTQTQRTQLLAQNRGITQLPTVVSLATLGEATKPNTGLLKAAPGSMTQFFEIKSGQLGKGPHLVNVVRQPQPGKVARLDLNDAKKRQVVFDGTALKGNIQAVTRPHRVNVSLDGRQIVRAALPAVRAPHVRHQIQLKNRTFQMATPVARTSSEPSTSIAVAGPMKTASLTSTVVANLLQKNAQLPKGGPKISLSAAGGQPLSANVHAIAFSTAQLKARQARLVAQPRAHPATEIVEASTAPVATSSSSAITEPHQAEGDEAPTNGAVRRRTADTLPMEVT